MLYRMAGDETMQASAEHMRMAGTEVDDFVPEETQSIPFFGFVTSTIVSVFFWAAVGWGVWALMN